MHTHTKKRRKYKITKPNNNKTKNTKANKTQIQITTNTKIQKKHKTRPPKYWGTTMQNIAKKQQSTNAGETT